MTVLFPASVVGSMPRSDFVRDLVADQGTIDPDATRQRLDAAVAYVVALQERAGLDVVTDGEWRRGSYIGVIAELAHGFEIGRFPDGRIQTVAQHSLKLPARDLNLHPSGKDRILNILYVSHL